MKQSFFSLLRESAGAGLLATVATDATQPLADKAIFVNGLIHPSDPDRLPFWTDFFATLPTDLPLPRLERGILIERISNRPRLVICGGGHIAVSLCAIGAMLSFETIVIDDRPEFANEQRFPTADRVICAPFAQAFASFAPRADDYYVIITRGHKDDRLCLTQALERSFTYAGMIGSRRKVAVVMDELCREGYPSEQLAKVYAPIGLRIGAQTPEEIAVCIAAQLIEVRSRHPQGDFTPALLDRLCEGHVVLATLVHKAGSSPRGLGAKLLADESGLIVGTIGGGSGEAEVLRQSANVLRDRRPRLVTCDMTNANAADAGMVCGGTITVLLDPCFTESPAHLAG